MNCPSMATESIVKRNVACVNEVIEASREFFEFMQKGYGYPTPLEVRFRASIAALETIMKDA